MRYTKMLALAAMAATTVLALAGAGAATATVICKNNSNTETCSEPYAIGTEGTASLASGSSASLFDVEAGETVNTCTKSTVTGKLKSQGGGKPALSELTTLTFGGCSLPTTTVSPGSGELTWIKGTDNGTLRTSGTRVTINTIFFGKCEYGTGESLDMGTTVGGNPGSLAIEQHVPFVSGGALCPRTVLFTAKYVATNPTNVWVSNG